MSLGKAQIIHIVVEVILLIAISAYFQSQNKKLTKEVNMLKTIVQNHDKALKVLFSNVPIKRQPPSASVENNESNAEEQEEEQEQEQVQREQEEEKEQEQEFSKEVEEEVNKISQEERTSILQEPDMDFDISESKEQSFTGTKTAIDTVLIIGQDEEEEVETQNVEFLPTKRKRTVKKGKK